LTRGIAGLTQRILFVQLQAWIVAMGWVALRISSPSKSQGAYQPQPGKLEGDKEYERVEHV
jgi:hypothetical protein